MNINGKLGCALLVEDTNNGLAAYRRKVPTTAKQWIIQYTANFFAKIERFDLLNLLENIVNNVAIVVFFTNKKTNNDIENIIISQLVKNRI